ncbi:hypothetical protein PUN28_005426 [Cardiocondyla obscurior]|uniref:Uncharacterized protein n=1 Tax=Cardiocondyla obscurior TaxID=286306 RepID=A0AAW2GHT4_9HYME
MLPPRVSSSPRFSARRAPSSVPRLLRDFRVSRPGATCSRTLSDSGAFHVRGISRCGALPVIAAGENAAAEPRTIDKRLRRHALASKSPIDPFISVTLAFPVKQRRRFDKASVSPVSAPRVLSTARN